MEKVERLCAGGRGGAGRGDHDPSRARAGQMICTSLPRSSTLHSSPVSPVAALRQALALISFGGRLLVGWAAPSGGDCEGPTSQSDRYIERQAKVCSLLRGVAARKPVSLLYRNPRIMHRIGLYASHHSE
jgi:hypothetical protein